MDMDHEQVLRFAVEQATRPNQSDVIPICVDEDALEEAVCYPDRSACVMHGSAFGIRGGRGACTFVAPRREFLALMAPRPARTAKKKQKQCVPVSSQHLAQSTGPEPLLSRASALRYLCVFG